MGQLGDLCPQLPGGGSCGVQRQWGVVECARHSAAGLAWPGLAERLGKKVASGGGCACVAVFKQVDGVNEVG